MHLNCPVIDVQAFHKALGDREPSPTERLVQACVDEGVSAQEVLDQGLLAAMAIVGAAFKAGELWVPEVLLAARNMRRGIDLLRPLLLAGGAEPAATIVIGTVQGDLHDVGKNIVSVLMEGSGFRVIDLGIDVGVDRFLLAIDEHRPDVVGLSALLTTTMLTMRDTVAAIRDAKGDDAPKVIVGGAPVTQRFAEEIGADGYGEDAVSGVEIALKLLGKGG